MQVIIEMLMFCFGGFIGVVVCSERDAWLRYRKRIGKGAFDTVYKKVLDIEHRYFLDGNIDAVNDCIRLENLLNYFKEEICDGDI